MSIVNMKQLLEAGVHFGHPTKRWDPKMKPFIFGKRNGIYIINLQETNNKLKEAYGFIRDKVTEGVMVLFVGTKKQAQEIIKEEAISCGMPFVTRRWIGGTLTNFDKIRSRVNRLKELEELITSGAIHKYPSKEQRLLVKEKDRLEILVGGLKEMKSLPKILFIVDLRKEHNAIKEAVKLNIPIVAVVDTNCNPEQVDYPIPGNDDAIRAIKLFTQVISSAVKAAKEGKEELPIVDESTSEITEQDKELLSQMVTQSGVPSGVPSEDKEEDHIEELARTYEEKFGSDDDFEDFKKPI